ncbi:YitT family protein [Curvibacter sp. CHRR-16]|uniref:YitT family protein n=1 Tax=Curvibacter sp. CHRR-16 TaxID=2835872 RepID=UPI001BDAC59B|nr:YitT family protein [Curvibacter sp. CHRR-16]MBT0570831.1 YitT family protein [Curvibacter sp. CHRR-16]
MTDTSTPPAPSAAPSAAPATPPTAPPHSTIEDVLALLLGTIIVSFGANLLKQAGDVTGGMAGLAFVLHYALHWPFGVVFFCLNLPFYYLAFKRMGWAFVIKTFSAIVLFSVFTEVHPHFFSINTLNPIYAAVLANCMLGVGFLILFRHRSSMGGFSILALYLQDRYHVRAGKIMMGFDVAVIATSFWVVAMPVWLASIAGAVILNIIIAMNHRADRYRA